MENKFSEERKYLRAKKKVKQLKMLYVHLFWYFAVNITISVMKISRNLEMGETFNQAFFDFGTFAVWLFWGVGVLIHVYCIYGKQFFYSSEWEERKIQEFMNKDQGL